MLSPARLFKDNVASLLIDLLIILIVLSVFFNGMKTGMITELDSGALWAVLALE